MNVNLLAPAKINLSLEVLKKRNDGYHDVDMILQSINLFDEIFIEKNYKTDIILKINKNINCSMQQNIAFKAAKIFFDYIGTQNYGVDIFINKHIPVCAGLAGGSSDGAAVILGLNNLFGSLLSKNDLIKLGERLGADVPFCFLGGTARAQGIGTTLTSISPLSKMFIVLVKPNLSVSTKEAYNMIDNSKLYTNNKTLNLMTAIENRDINNIMNGVYNHFEEILNIDIVNHIKNILKDTGANAVCMSGSGPSIYGLYLDKNIAVSSFNYCKSKNMEVFLCEPINYGVKII